MTFSAISKVNPSSEACVPFDARMNIQGNGNFCIMLRSNHPFEYGDMAEIHWGFGDDRGLIRLVRSPKGRKFIKRYNGDLEIRVMPRVSPDFVRSAKTIGQVTDIVASTKDMVELSIPAVFLNE